MDSKVYATRSRTPKQRYAKFRHLSKSRGIPFDISYEAFCVLIELPCFYCFGPLPEAGYGLDRIDNNRGYALVNVVPCCARCNSMKSDHTNHQDMKALMGLFTLIRRST